MSGGGGDLGRREILYDIHSEYAGANMQVV